MKENSIKNERSSIEEAIERLEYIDRTYSYNNYYSIWDLKCIEILLSDYKRVLKENNRLEEQVEYDKTHIFTPQTIKLNYIPIQIVKDNIEKEIKYHERNILEIENITMLKSKTAKEEAEIEFNKYAIVVLKKILQELIEERGEENHEENI